jgi:EAL domain-containing protein (putative c-di-GMP-specific phosphodiesterase class I)
MIKLTIFRYNKVMDQRMRKVLFSGIGDKIEGEIRDHLTDNLYIYEFCNFEDTESYFHRFNPDLLITAVYYSFEDYENQVSLLKAISDSFETPLGVIINRSSEDPYFFLLKNRISNIITSPLNKQQFLSYVDKFISPAYSGNLYENGNTIINDKTCSDSENFLISNLVTQNRMLKNHLKKIKPEDKLEKVHFERVNEHRLVENRLWEAYENDYFKLFYQPVISLESGKLSGFEALIRIIHPEEGLILPDKFIAVAENSAIIFPLGLWIIEESCRQINIWKNRFILDTPLHININLSAKQFLHPDLTHHIFEITERLDINENDIAFELTESAFMEDMESANIALLELRARKFALYMDDFGTGYSSLSYLMHFPVNVIKIDQSFVKWMHIDEQSETLVKSLVALAHNLGLKVVAEGTDDESHIEILKECGCDYAQGYYYAKPLPAEEADRFVSDHFETK